MIVESGLCEQEQDEEVKSGGLKLCNMLIFTLQNCVPHLPLRQMFQMLLLNTVCSQRF